MCDSFHKSRIAKWPWQLAWARSKYDLFESLLAGVVSEVEGEPLSHHVRGTGAVVDKGESDLQHICVKCYTTNHVLRGIESGVGTAEAQSPRKITVLLPAVPEAVP